MPDHLLSIGVILNESDGYGDQGGGTACRALGGAAAALAFDVLAAGHLSRPAAEEFAVACPEARLFVCHPSSAPVCKQIILDNCCSEYIFFCPPVCVPNLEVLKNLLEQMQASPDVSVIFGKLDHVNGAKEAGWGCCMARRSALTIAGGFPVDLSPAAFQEGNIMTARLTHAGYKERFSEMAFGAMTEPLEDKSPDGTQGLVFRRHDVECYAKEVEHLSGLDAGIKDFFARGEKIKVLLMHDREGWAWWHRSHNIKNSIASQFDVSIIHWDDAYDEGAYDLVVCFDANFYDRVKQPVKDPGKLVLGCSNDKLITATRHICSVLPHAGVVANSYLAYNALRYDLTAFCCQNGVDGTLFYPSPTKPDTFTACWVGNPKHLGKKGLDIIELACKAAGVPLLISNRELGDSYSHTELRDNIYHKASVYLCASEAEGTPNPALESMACGLPVISTRVGNMVEMLVDGYNGFLVDRDVRAFAQALRRIKKMDQSELSAHARWTIDNGWLWTQQVKKYESMFKSLACQRLNRFNTLKISSR